MEEKYRVIVSYPFPVWQHFRRKKNNANLDDNGEELENEVIDADVPNEVVQRVHFPDRQEDSTGKKDNFKERIFHGGVSFLKKEVE